MIVKLTTIFGLLLFMHCCLLEQNLSLKDKLLNAAREDDLQAVTEVLSQLQGAISTSSPGSDLDVNYQGEVSHLSKELLVCTLSHLTLPYPALPCLTFHADDITGWHDSFENSVRQRQWRHSEAISGCKLRC